MKGYENSLDTKKYAVQLKKVKTALFGYLPDIVLIVNYTGLSESDCAKALPPNQNWEYLRLPTSMSNFKLISQSFYKEDSSCVVFIAAEDSKPDEFFRSLFPYSRFMTLDILEGVLHNH